MNGETDGDAIAELDATFATLGFWRKLYLVALWLSTVFVVWLLVAAAGEPDFEYAGVALGIAVLSAWTHWAVVRRRVGHLTAIAILNLVPGANLVGCLIMVSIRRVSVRERAAHALQAP